jgi:hypothetical protein
VPPHYPCGHGFADSFRTGRRYGHADFLCGRGSQPVVHSGVRRRVRYGIGVWLPARRVAVRRGRGYMGGRRRVSLANAPSIILETANAQERRREGRAQDRQQHPRRDDAFREPLTNASSRRD